MPEAVLKRAQQRLHQLEASAHPLEKTAIQPHITVEQAQLSLFSSNPTADTIVEKLNGINVDDLTPRAALDLLYQLKALTKV
jgi:DNA mismatch repair protein MutS